MGAAALSGDRNLKRVRTVAEGETDWLEIVCFWQLQGAKFAVSKEAHRVDSARHLQSAQRIIQRVGVLQA